MANIKERVIKELYDRRQRIIDGKINSIPSPFKRFSNEFIGIEQGKYYLITGGTKSAKTQFSSYTFLYTPLLYAFTHPKQVRLKIFYFNLEESQEDVIKRFMSHILYVKTHYKIRKSPVELASTQSAIDEAILNILLESDYQELLDFFEKTVEFGETAYPTGIWKQCKNYADEHGKTYTKKIEFKDELGMPRSLDAFDYYVPDDPDEYKIIIVDHVSLLSSEKNKSLKETIDKLSEYCVKLRNRYAFTPVIIQQQSLAQESLQSIKMDKLRPSLTNASDSKYPARDCNVALGIFSPFRFELDKYQDYDIKVMKDNIRFIEVIIDRAGSPGGLLALFFDGAVSYFEELPDPHKDKERMQEIYDAVERRRGISLMIYAK